MLKLIFIDIDNTLLDFDEYVRQTMKVGFTHFGLKAYEPYMYDIFTTENNKLWHRIEDGTLIFSELEKTRWNVIFEKIGINFDGTVFEKYFRSSLNESAIPVSGAFEMLSALKKRFTLCAASNGPYNQQLHRLKLAGMDKYFNYFFISEQVGASKPSKEFFDYAFTKINETRLEKISPCNCMIIGDSMTSDMKGGIDYGMKTCFYRRNHNINVENNVNLIVDDLINAADLIINDDI